MNKPKAERGNTRSRRLLEDSIRSFVPIWIALGLVACGIDDPLSSSSQSLVAHNRLAANRLASNRLASNRLASNRLAANQLSSSRFSLAYSDLIDSEDGREVLTYIVSCAIPEGITLAGTDSQGNPYQFSGELGLAPRWLDHPLNRAEKRWVSACLFARVNVDGVPVQISLRGPSHALAVTPEEQASWTLQEGAFYGMYFTPPGQPIDWIACRGKDSEQAQLHQRACAQPDPSNPGKTLCGFKFAGECGRYFTAPTPTACQSFSPDGYYQHCADQAIFAPGGHRAEGDHEDGHGGDDDRSPIFPQVITTFVHP